MSPTWLDGYIDAWLRHPEFGVDGDEEILASLLAFMSPDVRYEDVPTGGVFIGHEGIREMGDGARRMSNNMSFAVGHRMSGDGSFAFETVCRGTNTEAIGPLPGNGASFSLRGVSIGEVSEEGLVTSQRDYWDLAGLLGQLGVSL